MWWADRQAASATVRDVAAVGAMRGLLVGCAQAIALVPGTSRSGITISAGLLLGLDRATAARFAFLLGLPITMAAGLVKAPALAAGADPGTLALLVGLLAAFLAGLAAVWGLVRFLQRRTLRVFVVYRIVLGAAVLWLAR
jgi:undecaprenyl-diphosphatase